MDIFDRIELLLKRNHMSQADLSRATGISTGLISQWKKRSQNPSNQKLAILAKYFDVSVDYLLGKEKEPATDSDRFRLEDEIDLTDVDIAFLGGFKELTEENQATIRDMVRIMRERQKE